MNEIRSGQENDPIQAAEAYLSVADRVLQALREKRELFGEDLLDRFATENNTLANRIRAAKEECRRLSIGIIGSVKAGKSSFLNALLFNGEELLPKAATPMTAALTKLSYADSPRAVVHFYTREDWAIIEDRAKEYDKLLGIAYEQYCEECKQASKRSAGRQDGAFNMPRQPMTKNAFRTSFDNQPNLESLRAAKELVEMTEKNADILQSLGGTEVLSGDVAAKMQEYVSASGRYTPIVNYIEYQSDNQALKDLEIIDTPGLNDPIVSRGVKTKEFLSHCDVVILLSPCSQFMNADTIRQITHFLPSAGVNELVVVGSKLDSGVLNDKGGVFLEKLRSSLKSYKLQFSNNLLQIRNSGMPCEIIGKLDAEQVLFCSSICFNIHRKIKSGLKLNKEEENIYRQLRTQYTGFDDSFLPSLAGFSQINKKLKEILKRKAEILESRDGGLMSHSRRNHLQTLDDIRTSAVSRKNMLQSVDLDDIQRRSEAIQHVIDSSRAKLRSLFETTALTCEKRVVSISADILAMVGDCTDIKVTTSTETVHGSVKTGWFRREAYTDHITHYSASTSEVNQNIVLYHSKCIKLLSEEFDYLFNEEQFSRQVKDIVLTAFEKSDCDFSEDDVLLPLNTVLARIKIPTVSISHNPYIDRLNSTFPSGAAKDETISKLKGMQSELINAISEEILRQLKDCTKTISEIMSTQAVTFADEIEKKFLGILQDLTAQAKDKQKFLAMYEAFITEAKGLIALLADYQTE